MEANHQVQIIGWNDAIPKEAFCTEWIDGKPAGGMPPVDGGWPVRNSWGKDGGMDGCFYLPYADCFLSETCPFIASADPLYDHQCQYDGTGWNTTAGVKDKPTAPALMANVLTAARQEQIQSLAFYTTLPDAPYSIQVYTGLRGRATPDSGPPAFSEEQAGSEPHAGYHTIELNEAVPIREGERFPIVVKLENSPGNSQMGANDTIYPIPCDSNGPCSGAFSDAAPRPKLSPLLRRFLAGSRKLPRTDVCVQWDPPSEPWKHLSQGAARRCSPRRCPKCCKGCNGIKWLLSRFAEDPPKPLSESGGRQLLLGRECLRPSAAP